MLKNCRREKHDEAGSKQERARGKFAAWHERGGRVGGGCVERELLRGSGTENFFAWTINYALIPAPSASSLDDASSILTFALLPLLFPPPHASPTLWPLLLPFFLYASLLHQHPFRDLVRGINRVSKERPVARTSFLAFTAHVQGDPRRYIQTLSFRRLCAFLALSTSLLFSGRA